MPNRVNKVDKAKDFKANHFGFWCGILGYQSSLFQLSSSSR